jgi:hypothetical protein
MMFFRAGQNFFHGWGKENRERKVWSWPIVAPRAAQVAEGWFIEGGCGNLAGFFIPGLTVEG